MGAPFFTLLVSSVSICLVLSLAALAVIVVVIRKDRNDTRTGQDLLKEFLTRVNEREAKWRKWLSEALQLDEAAQKKALTQLIELEGACAKAHLLLYLHHDKAHFNEAENAFLNLVDTIQKIKHKNAVDKTNAKSDEKELKPEIPLEAVPEAVPEAIIADTPIAKPEAKSSQPKADEAVKADEPVPVDESVKVDAIVQADEAVKTDEAAKVDETVKANEATQESKAPEASAEANPEIHGDEVAEKAPSAVLNESLAVLVADLADGAVDNATISDVTP